MKIFAIKDFMDAMGFYENLDVSNADAILRGLQNHSLQYLLYYFLAKENLKKILPLLHLKVKFFVVPPKKDLTFWVNQIRKKTCYSLLEWNAMCYLYEHGAERPTSKKLNRERDNKRAKERHQKKLAERGRFSTVTQNPPTPPFSARSFEILKTYLSTTTTVDARNGWPSLEAYHPPQTTMSSKPSKADTRRHEQCRRKYDSNDEYAQIQRTCNRGHARRMDESSREDKSHSLRIQHGFIDATPMSLNQRTVEVPTLMTSEHEAINDSATTEAGY
ncbi:hypothetical protein HBI81_251080 [Parastagonospora nodorum]|nr:hypothetical protein HBH53_251050 [Parastagonospora nodorum]KAH3956138.1 hypothetical protein HBH51_251700 [Parastagonospora nodorum]KAH4890849.1 hypothetical protein HBH74_234440 [Parastagonospora nodorum]KAH5050585.1 hypothetical protein HBI73_242710 [Parastagonospora nodorum]KAH5097135.1 hypothetical protein HBH71_249090 [Parastagonospora nodorum]